MHLKVGIIGAGKRVQQTILPAIWALGDKVGITSIHSRTPRDIKLPNGSVMQSTAGLGDMSLDGIDILIVAVGTKSLLPILRELQTKANRNKVALVMDTPPLNISHIWRVGVFKNFKHVEVGEDWARLSPILIAKEIIGRGDIGTLQSILLDRMSYRYHGIATLKTLASVQSVASARRGAKSDGMTKTAVTLGNNITATLVEPRNYDEGRILISGTKGSISLFQPEAETQCEFEVLYAGKPQGWYQPISVNGETQEPDLIEQTMTTLPSDYLSDDSPINLLKIRGYARLLEDIMNGDECYPISNGLYDYLLVVMTEKRGRFRDLSLSNGRNSLLHRLLSLHSS